MRELTALFCVVLLAQAANGRLIQDDALEVRLPEGFSIQRVADDSLATNVFCMATDPKGRVYVSGPGYIRRLIDKNGDGQFDTTQLFSDLPKSGAQGMWFGETSMLFTGDGGIWSLRDADGDGVADGSPERRLPIKTGSEHLAHAIRKGHDGWFYILAGNNTPILESYYQGTYSPVRNPRAGFLMRLSPDFKTGEIVADGFRNAYDFAFNREGKIFVYDSDGERDISLPWYRPTRVYEIQPGDDAGWLSAGWKRPSSFFDMPFELGEFGRGSPTGVQCYRGQSYPKKYADAIFVADWTFGRIHVFKKDSSTGRYDRGSEFAISDGQFGFAVTDLAIDADGNLLVSVGGRGTSGAVYRIVHSQTPSEGLVEHRSLTPIRKLAPFNSRQTWSPDDLTTVLASLRGEDPETSLVALESLIGRAGQILESKETSAQHRDALLSGIKKNLETFDPRRAKLVLNILQDWQPAWIQQVDRSGLPSVSRQILKLAEVNRIWESPAASSETAEAATAKLIDSVLSELESASVTADAVCRIGQLALGDVGQADAPEMFKGYTANRLPKSLELNRDRFANRLADLISQYRQKSTTVDKELGRLAGMLKANSRELENELVAGLATAQSPVDAIHWLNCLAATGVIRSESSVPVAQTLVDLDQRIRDAGLQTDRNWVPRMRQLCRQLFDCQPLISAEVSQRISGRDGQVFLFDELPTEYRVAASQKFLAAVARDLGEASSDQLRIAAANHSPETRTVLREAASYRHLRETAILALALRPDPQDREFYRKGLDLGNSAVAASCAAALMRFAAEPNSGELLPVGKILRSASWDKQGAALRDQLMRLVQHQTGKSFGYRFNQKTLDQSKSVQAFLAHLAAEFPSDYQSVVAVDPISGLADRLDSVDWSGGDPSNGQRLYRDLKCSQCHDGGSRLGPRLDGVTKRFNRDDLFRSIVAPSGQIPDRYRATVIETVDGLLYRGTVIYESVDGVTLQDVNGITIRINRADIESKTLSEKSLMPSGLLDNVDPQDWADLYAFLKQL